MTPLERGQGLWGASVDVLVIGAGITGAAVAYDAASRGLSVALIDAADFGGATSAATGKMIHGGLRYLKTFQVGLVHESLQERKNLSNIAGPYVYPLAMMMPQAGLLERVGLLAYDSIAAMAGRPVDPDKRLPWHHWLTGDDAAARTYDGVSKALQYFDCLMPDPERLTLAFVRSAAAHGAIVANYVRAQELIMSGSVVTGARIEDALTGRSGTVTARAVVNATGPWSFDLVHQSFASALPKPTVRSEGIYLLTRQLTRDVTVFTGRFGHFSFAPWRGMSMIGPTESAYRGAVSDWRLTVASIENFLRLINEVASLPQPLTMADVRYAWGGLRPLTEATESTYEASRGAEVFDHAADGVSGIVTAAGGKYTTSRAFARHIVDAVAKTLGARVAPSRTDAVPLDGCEVGRTEEFVDRFVSENPHLAPRSSEWLARHYGTQAPHVAALIAQDRSLGDVLDDDGEVLAQAVFAARHESAMTLTDVVMRRTGLGTKGVMEPDALTAVAAAVASVHGWDERRLASEREAVDKATALPTA